MFNFGDTKLFQLLKKNPKCVSEEYLWKSPNLVNRAFGEFGKRRAPENPEESFNKLLKILNMGSISSRKHEMGICQLSIEGT